MHLFRDYVKSMTFVALALVGYTFLMLSFAKADAHREFRVEMRPETRAEARGDVKTETKSELELRAHASPNSHTEASLKTAVVPEHD